MKEQETALFELGVRLERWAKRNKIWLILGAAALVVWGASFAAWNFAEDMRLKAANKAFATLQLDANNSEARRVLEAKSPELYDLFTLKRAAEEKDAETLAALAAKKSSIASDLAAYQSASLAAEADKLGAYEARETKFLKDLALLQEAFLLIKAKDGARARDILSKVSPLSEIKPDAESLEHFAK
ncbi:MAG: hypothetical protein LBU73_07240 [Helicobacteraceae bacterium]|jgi:hypothetical protein|nr:hypothetical protein [Helicobacteraceae bacterium]